jgi:hypothetical protein
MSAFSAKKKFAITRPTCRDEFSMGKEKAKTKKYSMII